MSLKQEININSSNKISKKEIDLYKKMFKFIITKNIVNFTLNEELKSVLSSIKDKQIHLSYIIFSKYYLSYTNNNIIKEDKFLFNSNKEFNINIKIIILWYIFLFDSITNKKMNLEKNSKKLQKMNQLIYLLEETNLILFKLHLIGKLNEEQIFLFIDLYLFWIEYYSNYYFINEKNRKLKNMYIFKILFSFVNKITQEIIKAINKEKLDILINFMEKLKKNDEINKEYNVIILVKFYFIQSFIQNILSKSNLDKIKKINGKFQDILINFYSHFLKFKFNLSNIFDVFLDNTRIAYEHLYNFEDNINLIIHDLNIQHFQTKLFNKIIKLEENTIIKEEHPLMNDSFLFNGVDSVIAFKINNFDYEQKCLFFSFNFNPSISNNNNNIYPLLAIQKEISKDSKNFIYQNIFLLYLEKSNKKENGSDLYMLNISQSLLKNNAFINKKQKIKIYIKKNINYYCCLQIEAKSIELYLYYDILNENNKMQKINVKIDNMPKKDIILSFGCDSLLYNKELKEKDEKKNYFSGYIGPVILIKDLIPKLFISGTLEEIIEKILSLKEGYKEIVFLNEKVKFINDSSITNNYNKDYIDYSFNNKISKNEKNIYSFLKTNCEAFECLLYLFPNCFIYFDNKSDVNKNYHLPLVSNICNKHKDYTIKKINIALFKYNLSMPNFIYSNGINYFCLQLEYFNQLSQYYLVNKRLNNENFHDIFINQNNNNILGELIDSIKVILITLANLGTEVNLSKAYKQTFMTLFNLLKNLNKIKPIVKDIIGDLISLSDIYKCNIFTNYYNLRDLLNTQQNIKNEIEKGNDKNKNKRKRKILTEEALNTLKENYNSIIKRNGSFFLGIIEILLYKDFYMNDNNSDTQNYLLMKLTFEKVSSLMDIKDYDCLYFFSYPNLFLQALSFTSLLQNYMDEYLPNLQIFVNHNIFYSNIERRNSKANLQEEDNVLVSYFKLLNIFFKNKSINKSTTKEYFQKLFRFVLGNHRYNLSIVYNYLYMIYFLIAENDKLNINYEEIMQLFDYLNEITELKEEDIYKIKNNNNNFNVSIKEKEKKEEKREKEGKEEKDNKKEKDDKKEKEEKYEKKENIFYDNINNFTKKKEKIKSVIICIIIEAIFSQEEMPESFDSLLNYLNEIKISKNLFLLIRDEIDKYFHIIFNDNEYSLSIKKNIKDLSKYYSNLFKLLRFILYILLSDNIEYFDPENNKKENNDNNLLNTNIESKKMWYILSVLNILSDISNNIEDNINKEKYKEESIHCSLNFLKFLFDIIKDSKLNVLFAHDLFITISENVFNHCSKLSLNNSNILIDLNKDKGNMKTFIELIFDFYMEYSMNICLNNEKVNYFKKNNNNIQTYSLLKMQNYFIYKNPNKKLKDKDIYNYKEHVSIFFINDYLNLLFTNKKYLKNDLFYFNINEKMNEIKEINNIINSENKFDLIFMIFFLIKIGTYKQEISEKLKIGEKSKTNILHQLYDILIYMQKVIIDDYKKLFILNKDYCTKSISEFQIYNIIRNSVDLKIKNETKKITNENIFTEFITDLDLNVNSLSKNEYNLIRCGLSLNFLIKIKPKKMGRSSTNTDLNNNYILSDKDSNKENQIIDRTISTKDKTENIILFNNNDLDNTNNEDKENNNENKDINEDKEKSNNILNEIKDEKEVSDNIFNFIGRDSSYINRIIPLPDIDIHCFFERYDEMYLKNPKKELMNTIFSLSFKKSFYYNDTFEILKNYFLNNFPGEEYTKKLNYPSKMKHFNNGLEPPLFLKYNKSFYLSKVFPVTHKYFYNYMQNNKIINNSIILFKNDINLFNLIKNNKNENKNDFDYNCELLLIDHSFFGHLINSNDNKLLIFKEKKFDLYEKEPSNSPEYYEDLFSICSIIKKPKLRSNDIINENQRNTKTKIVERGINKNLIILYSEIEQIIERRFLLMWQGIEIYLKNGKSYFFNLLDDCKCKTVLEKLNNNIELSKKIIIKNNFERDILAIQKEWVNNRLETYEYLLFINKYSSRTYNDSNQYYIFPWLLKDYNKLYEINNNEHEIYKYISQMLLKKIEEKEEKIEENLFDIDLSESDSKENISGSQNSKKINKILSNSKLEYDYFKYFREFKYPICAQTQRNKDLAIKRYIQDCIFKFKYHSGTHYSTSAYVYFFLMRNEPFSTLLVKLQNYCQENPNRMFNSVQETFVTLNAGNDNRELLPEFYSKIDFFINFNCVNFGMNSLKKLVDDAYIIKSVDDVNNDENQKHSSFNIISIKINFLIENKKLLNSNIISVLIGDWIDNIFGYNQLPKVEDRPLTCNIFPKSTYEQEKNLKRKLNKYLSPEYTKKTFTPPKLVKRIADIINMIICFGQTPYQLFKEKHPKRKKEDMKKAEENEEKTDNEDKKKYSPENDMGEDFLLGDDDVQSLIINFIRPEKTIFNLEVEGLYFEINPFINKVFILSKKREILILNSKLYDRKGVNFYNIYQEQKIELPYIKYFEKINNEYLKDYYILKQKYCFSSFLKEENDINNSPYFYYYNKYVNNLINDKSKNINNEMKFYKFITCRYLDNTFKIILFQTKAKDINQRKKENNKNENYNKIFSFECEDFVSSCCSISNDSFFIGLKNGKLIKGNIIENKINEKENEIDKIELQIDYDKYIQGHKGSINIIEIDFRLGIIITGGEDNYIYIRKLYDLELLTPIKIKDKFIISMAKISPMNLLYVLCFNKKNRHSVIFGYNLSGIRFAKSECGFFTNIDFTRSGNIVSLINKIDIGILCGSNLRRIKIKESDEECKEFIDKQKKVDGALWLQYDYFIRKTANKKCRIISYIAKDYTFNTINVDNIKYFD